MRSQINDEVWVAENEGEIVAAHNLRPVTGGQWLAGLFVAPAVRRRGVATALLAHSLAERPEAIWLFCHPELRSFYVQLGFADCNQLPTELAERLARYQRSKSLLSMRAH